MYRTGNEVIFERSDQAFVRKFGAEVAAQMVLDYQSAYPLPFLYDTYQLARFLKIRRKDLFNCVRHSDQDYRTIVLKKKNGGTRRIHAPQGRLRACQDKILHEILAQLPVSKYAKAYTKGSTLVQNAAPHVGKKYILKLDITDFFNSIYFEKVYSAAFNIRYFPKQIGVMLTALCCRKNFLPQGAPTSPAISNLVMRNFDDAIGSWCEQRGISYTRYCDDMTFSSNHPLFAVYEKVKKMLEDMNLELNERKTNFFTRANRQSVTGLTVNDKVSVSRSYKQQLRQEVYYVLKFGLAEQILHTKDEHFITDGVPDTEAYFLHLMGRLRFVLQIEPENGWFQTALIQLQSKQSGGR